MRSSRRAETDGFVGKVCARVVLRARGIAFVEDEVDHLHHDGEALAALDRARRFERHAGFGDLRLGARDALLHRCFADEKGARDLLHGEARHDAQGQRDLLRRRQVGMAADEQQAQHVVAILAVVEPLGHRRLDIFEIGDLRLVRHGDETRCLALLVERRIAADHDQPRDGSRGGPLAVQLRRARRHASW